MSRRYRPTLALLFLALFVAALPAAAQNLVTNSGFDSGFAGWTNLEQVGVVKTDWRAEDATGDVNSGSVRVEHDQFSTGTVTGFLQCIPVVAGTEYQVSARTRVLPGQSATGTSRVDMTWFSGGSCQGSLFTSNLLTGGATPAWDFNQAQITAPSPASSAWVMLRVEKTSDPDEDFEADFDDVAVLATGATGGGECVPDATTLCIDDQPGDGRFRIQGQFQTTQGGGSAGQAGAISLDPVGVTRGGLLWFFRQENPEVLVKVLDGCPVNGHYWVFYSAGTNVGFTLRVEDLVGEQTWFRTNPDRNPAPPVQDTQAFPCE